MGNLDFEKDHKRFNEIADKAVELVKTIGDTQVPLINTDEIIVFTDNELKENLDRAELSLLDDKHVTRVINTLAGGLQTLEISFRHIIEEIINSMFMETVGRKVYQIFVRNLDLKFSFIVVHDRSPLRILMLDISTISDTHLMNAVTITDSVMKEFFEDFALNTGEGKFIMPERVYQLYLKLTENK